jgi:DNA repair protein RadD
MSTPQDVLNLIELGKLSPFRVYAPSSHLKPDLEGIKTVKGDYAEGELAARMSKPDLIADAVAEWKKRRENRPTLVFAVSRPHAMKLQAQFLKAGVRAGYVDMDTPMDERERIGAALKAGELQAVVNINCLTTGVDWPFVSCLSLCRPTKQEHTDVQIIGRALRTCEGKSDAIILDHTDTTVRLGFVTDIVFDELDDGTKKDRKKSRKERKKSGPKECDHCGYFKPVGVRKCPDCGWEPKPQSEIEIADGELLELTANGRKVVKADKETKQAWFSMLRKIASMRTGMQNKDGWVAHKYRDRYGVWPRGLEETFEWPTDEVLAFVKAADQAYRNSRRAA